MMKFGISSFFGYELPLAERMRLIRNAGFDFTALWWGGEEKEFREGRKGVMPRMARDSGLSIDNIHVPFERCNRLWSLNAPEREAWVCDHLAWIEDCARYDIGMMVMHLTYGSDFPSPCEDGIASFAYVLSAAKRCNVRLAVENTLSEAHLDRLMERFDSPFLGLCYDSSHDYIAGPTPLTVLERYGERLLTTHLSDNDGESDSHWLPGEGVVDWRSLAAAPSLRRLGAVMLEVHGPREKPGPDPGVFLREARARVRSLFGCGGVKRDFNAGPAVWTGAHRKLRKHGM